MRKFPTFRNLVGIVLGLSLFACGDEGSKVKEVTEPPPKPTALEVSHDELELDAIGAKAQLVATVKDQKDRDFVGAQYAWSSSNPSVAMVDADGVVTAQANGEATIEVRSQGLEAEVKVRVAQVVTAAAIQPERVVLESVGAEQVFSAVALDRNDHPVRNVALTWTSEDPEIFSIDEEGVGTANKAGETAVVAKVEGGEVFATAKVVVAPVPAQGGVRVEAPDTFVSLQPATVRVRITDSAGNPVKGANHTVSLALGKNGAGARLGGERVVQATDGEAVFPGITVDKAGTGFSLIAQVAGLESGESGLFDVLPGPPAQLAFSVQPGGGVSGQPLSPAPRVEVLDAAGNRVASPVELQVSLGQNLIGGKLEGTTVVEASQGLALFNDLRIDKAWTGYTLRVTSEGLEEAESGVFGISPGSAHQLAFLGQPSRVRAGNPIAPAVQVEVLDAAGNRVVGESNRTIRLTLPFADGVVLGGTSTRVASSGVATFSDLTVDRASPEGSGYYLRATSSGLFPADSDFFVVDPGAPSRLRFVEEPKDAVSGTALPTVRVQAVDISGIPTSDVSGTVTIALGNRPAGGQLTGTLSAALVNGVAVFDDLHIARAGSGYTLLASSSTLGTVESEAFQVMAGPARQLHFLQQPSNGVSNEPIAPAVRVEVQDAAGNRVSDSTDTVKLQLVSNPFGASLVSPQEVEANNGVATFSNLRVDKAGSGFQLLASAPGLGTASSSTFSISAGTAAQLVFRSHPGSGLAGSPLSPAVEVEVQDAAGNPVSTNSLSVQIAIKDNPTGAQLSGATSVLTNGGVAVFSGLAFDRAGGPYTLEASAQNVSSATSGNIQILPGSASKLVFTEMPSNAISGQPFTVRVEARDAKDNPVPTATGQVSLAIDINPAGGVLSGTTVAPLINGVATFSNISIDKAGEGYTLAASSFGVGDGGSASFNVGPGAFAALAFHQQPGNAASGESVSAVVELRDAAGNHVKENGVLVSLQLGKNPGQGTLAGGGPVPTVDGRAVFSFSVDKAASGYTVRALANGRSVESAPFAISHGTAAALAFLVNPPNPLLSGEPMTPAIEVEVRDAAGNRVLNSNHQIALELAPNAKDALLAGPKSVAAVNGVATFPGLSVGPQGSGYTLVATPVGFDATATSTHFNVVPGNGARLAFSQQPAGGRSGVPMASPVVVRALDAASNPTTRATGLVTLSLGNAPAGASLSGTLSASFVNGVATFNNLILDKVGNAYTLIARAEGMADDESHVFEITAGAPAGLAFLETIPNAVSGANIPSVVVEVRDAAGNRTSDPVQVTLGLGQNPREDELTGTLSVPAVGGLATFSNVQLHLAGEGYTLVAQAPNLGIAQSNPFAVTHGQARKLGFSIQPRNGAAGTNLDVVKVQVLDQAGNRVRTGSYEILMRLLHNPAGGVLDGGITAFTTDGVAEFTTLRISRVGTYTLEAYTAGDLLERQESLPFQVHTGPPAKLAFKVEPGNSYPGFPITPAVEVEVQDAAGNPVVTAGHPVTISLIDLEETGAVLSGRTTVNAANGVATFPDLSLDQVGTYILRAENIDLGTANSLSFQVNLSMAHSLAFLTQPLPAPAGEALNPIQIEIRDENDERFLSANLPVTISLGENPSNGVLSGTLTVNPVNGVATFEDLSISRSGQGYTLVASMLDVPPVESEEFDVLGGQPAGIVWIQPPTDVSSLEPIDPVVEVEIVDMFGERVFSFDGEVSVSVGSGPPGASLRGALTVQAVEGRARFPGIAADLAGTYRLLVVPEQGTPSLSTQFEVSAGNPARLRFLSAPVGSTATGQTLALTQVAIEDEAGNQTDSGETVALSLVGGSGNPTLHGTVSVEAAAGMATFSDLSIREPGNYILLANAPNLPSIQTGASGIFAIHTGPIAQPRFLVQPRNGKAQDLLAPVEVVLQDAYGNRTNSTARVRLSLQGGSPGAVLSGGEYRAAQQGKATFSDLSVSLAGTDYQLVAHVENLSNTDTSEPFTIQGGEPKALRWVSTPTTAVSLEPMNPAFQVEVVDVFGERVGTFNGPVSLSIASGPAHAVLGGSTTVFASGGLATFSDLTLDRVGAYTLRASNGTLQEILSPAVEVGHGAPAHLVFQQPPTNTVSQVAMSPAVEVAVLDAAGNLVLGASGSITLEAGPGAPAGALLDGASASPVDGIASFPALRIDRAGTYTLIAKMGGLTSFESQSFRITAGPPAALAFELEPPDHEVGEAFPVEVLVVDAAGNPTAADGIEVRLSAENIQGPVELGGKTAKESIDGLAAFDNLRVSIVGNTFVLTAEADGLDEATSRTFTVHPGAPVGIVWVLQPHSAQAGANVGPLALEVVDSFGNKVTSYEQKLTVTPGPSIPGDATLEGDTEAFFAGGGVLLFNLRLDKAGQGYQLLASTADFGPFASAPFDVSPGSPQALAFQSAPSTGVAEMLLPPVEVAVVDEYGNRTDSSVSVSLALQGGPAGAWLSGTRNQSAEAGIATFADLSIDLVGQGYELVASAPGLGSHASEPFSITRHCAAPLTACEESCVDLQNDPAHCGACGTACDAGEICIAGSCALHCPEGMTLCDGVCRDLLTDPSFCGSCDPGNACTFPDICIMGVCQPQVDRNYAQWPLPPDAPVHYTLTENTVFDQITGLIWQRRAPNSLSDHASAEAYCQNLNLDGRSDWRLPTAIELLSIINTSTWYPAVTESVFMGGFEGVQPSGHTERYWSATSFQGSTESRYVDFANGASSGAARSTAYFVRCVRGGYGEGGLLRYAFVDNSEAVEDMKTGLVWQREASSETYTLEEARAACSALNIGDHSDWRLPSKKELESLIDWAQSSSPRIDSGYFTNTAGAAYWSNSNYLKDDWDRAWTVNFSNGVSSAASVGSALHVRCVRGSSAEDDCPGLGEARCDGVCVEIQSDPQNCGACGNACAPGQHCVASVCQDEPDYNWAMYPLLPSAERQYSFEPEGQTVKDEDTGLIWQRHAPAITFTADEALAYCRNLDLEGQRDWRLPTVIELLSLYDEGYSPARWYSAFTGSLPLTPSSARNEYYWTSTRVPRSSNVFRVSFDTGVTGSVNGSTSRHWVRCVRGGQPSVPAPHRYQVDEETVYDTFTQLTWQRRALQGTFSTSQAQAYCDRLALEGEMDWRLPTHKELATLVDRSKFRPAILVDRVAFPGTEANHYRAAGNYAVHFQHGGSTIDSGLVVQVRCVRDDRGEPPACDPGYNVCNKSCVDHQTDPRHCGACGNRCESNEYCNAGSCEPAPDYNLVRWPLPPTHPTVCPDPPDSTCSYVRSEDNLTVYDRYTDLTWMRAPPTNAVNLHEALHICSNLNFAGYADWRLPTIAELLTLFNEGTKRYDYGPYMTPGIFDVGFASANGNSRDQNANYWSSTPVDYAPGNFWYVNTEEMNKSLGATARSAPNSSSWAMRYRCVRGGHSARIPFQVVEADSDPALKADFVIDFNTSLAWQRDPNTSTLSFTNATNYCASFHVREDGADIGQWRVPTMRELNSIADFNRSYPAFDPEVFNYHGIPGQTAGGNYWTSSTRYTSSSSWPDNWLQSVDGSTAGWGNRSNAYYLRCVRDYQP